MDRGVVQATVPGVEKRYRHKDICKDIKLWASLVAQMGKNLPAIQETLV